eukprot:scaffold50145_cov49-Cyclotella_meneghiniana.AAC.3
MAAIRCLLEERKIKKNLDAMRRNDTKSMILSLIANTRDLGTPCVMSEGFSRFAQLFKGLHGTTWFVTDMIMFILPESGTVETKYENRTDRAKLNSVAFTILSIM